VADNISFPSALLTSAEAIGQLFLVVAVGFWFYRARHLDDSGVRSLTRLMIDVIVPCSLSVSMIRGFKIEQMQLYSPLLLFPPLWIVCTTILCRTVQRLIPGGRPSADRAATAMASIQNSFYIPLPVAMAVMPEHAALIGALVGVCVLAVNPLQWTLGSWLLAPDDKRAQANWRKSLSSTLNPPVLGIVGGVLLAQFPPVVAAANFAPDANYFLRVLLRGMSLLGQAMNPLAMFVLGALIAQAVLRTSITARTLLPIVLFRFVLVPGVIFYLLWIEFIPADRIVAFVLILEAASPSAMNLALAAKRFEGEWEVITSLLVVVNAIAVFVLPLWMALALWAL
jgi:malate permease and related proteins